MRLLFIHSDFIEYEARKPALRSITGPPAVPKDRMEEALVVFYSVEKPDEKPLDAVVAQALKEIQDVTSQVKTDNVALYPYAHLSSDLAKPDVAKAAGEKLDAAVRAAGFKTIHAPFGWYKSFSLKAKGHPLAELSRVVRIEEGEAGKPKESEALKSEKKLKSEWYVLTPEDDLVAADKFDFGGHQALEILYKHEVAKSRKATGEPPHVKLMHELELVDYEPGSDQGNFRWYPKGSLMKRLLERRVSDMVLAAGAMQVETPIMYDFQHPALNKYLQRFPARQYTVQSDDKEFFLRFAACFGQYLIAHDMTMSYRHLPLRLYELTHYSFRREQSGELAGLRRLRAFTMPDMHTLVRDIGEAKEEFKNQFKLSMNWMADLGFRYEGALRFVRSFFDENRRFAVELARLLNRPVLVEMWDERFFYFVMKFEFNVSDTSGKASALSTVQIDVENTERFDITYVDETGTRKFPLLLHCSVSGSVDRNVYAFLEQEAMKIAKGGKGAFPFWLAPTQLRLIPVKDEFLPACERLAKQLPGIRADIDDRDEGVSRKIRDAEMEWVPLILVYGEKEAASTRLPVRSRSEGQREFTVDELRDHVEKAQGEMPWMPLPVPVLLSRRPAFRG